MSRLEFKPAKREGVHLLVGIAGPSGSGKTLSSLLLAKGLSGGKPFAVIDTESGRALHYADDFDFLHADLSAPFSPERYAEAIMAAAALDPPVIVVDSASHEHAGEGGVLDMHEAELQRLAGDDWKKREAMKMSAWIKPKASRKRLISQLLQLRCHLILGLRAEDKVDIVKNPETGKVEVKPKRTLAGHVGWIPVCGKELPYELTLSLVVTPDAPGVPKPIKLPEQLRPFVPLDKPLSEETGQLLGEWAAGGSDKSSPPRVDGAGLGTGSAPSDTRSAPSDIELASEDDVESFLDLARRCGAEAAARAEGGLRKHRGTYNGNVRSDWLARQRAKLEELAPAADPAEDDDRSLFEGMVPEAARS